jgi:tetratricopeptide (TPR) repeat protein
MLLNDPAGAVPYYRRAVACFPGKVSYLLSFAKALELAKNVDEAYEYYMKVLAIEPANKDANDGRDRIDMQRF